MQMGMYPMVFFWIGYDRMPLQFIYSPKLFMQNIILVHFINFFYRPNDPKYIKLASLIKPFMFSHWKSYENLTKKILGKFGRF